MSAPNTTATTRFGTLGEREFVLFMALTSAMSALAIDTIIPAFGAMRTAFDLEPDSTRLSLTITVFFIGTGLGYFIFGPLADSLGRRRVLELSLALYGAGALIAALAPTLEVVYLGRFIWGFAAAGPRILSQAIVRDRYRGQELARVMTLIQIFFYLAPIAGPIVGRGVLEIGSWRWVFAFGTMTAVALAAWALRLPETLPPEHRRPLALHSTVSGLALAMRHPVTGSYALAIAVGFGAFYSFLGSSELILDEIFGRPEWFVPFFVAMGVLMGGVAFTTNRALRRVAAANWALGAGGAFLVLSLVLLGLGIVTDGVPDIWAFLVVYAAANMAHAGMFPTATSLALDPMGALAGTAAAAIGATISILGALLAAPLDRAVAGSITPVAVGYVVYAGIGLLLQLRGRRSMELAHEQELR
ncbi:MAG: MFS transporter [Acidimicrobiales bacterium]|nr:MAG: MFS transporter [Acidimicrobiales bacterium]